MSTTRPGMGAAGPRRPSYWLGWLKRWDEQQESFNPDREHRFSTMFDVVQASFPARFRALDLGSGPGSLSVRLLRRFPRAKCVAIDFDPVALTIGEGALGTFRGRLTWVDAKLGAPGWTDRLPAGRFDAALSTTALHWLGRRELSRLYRDLHGRLRPGGILLNGDHLPWSPSRRSLGKLAERVRRRGFRGRSPGAEWTAWRRWWRDVENIPELRPILQERERRHAKHPHSGDVPVDVHLRALRRAGFREAEVIWQNLENRVLYARK